MEGDGGEGWRGMEGRDGGGGTNVGEKDLGRGREWYWASSSFVVTSSSCFVMSFSLCPPRMSLLTCPHCRVVFAWVVHCCVVSISRWWWWFSCMVAAVSVWVSVLVCGRLSSLYGRLWQLGSGGLSLALGISPLAVVAAVVMWPLSCVVVRSSVGVLVGLVGLGLGCSPIDDER